MDDNEFLSYYFILFYFILFFMIFYKKSIIHTLHGG